MGVESRSNSYRHVVQVTRFSVTEKPPYAAKRHRGLGETSRD